MDRRQNQTNRFAVLQNLKDDVLASFVVFLVALPLCMGIALASGLPPSAGILTGILGGLVVGLISGSPMQVSGPAAGLTVIVFDIVRVHGAEALGVIVLLAGALQVLAGLCRLGQWFRAVSPAVIQGMLAGIGILLFASQFHLMVDDRPREGGLANLLSIPTAVWKGVVPSADTTHEEAALIGLLTIGTLLGWKWLAPHKLRFIPAALVAVVAATTVALVLDFPIRRVEMPASLLGDVHLPTLDTLRRFSDPALLASVLTVAIIASAETLLCAAAVDKLHRGPRTQYDRELGAQGVGNMLCGLLGVLPMTGVIVRSATNVEAGARTRLSAILHGLWLLLLVALLPSMLRLIPTASLAAVLVYTGCKLVNLRTFRVLREYGRGEVLIYVCTVTLVVVQDLLTGVLVGFGLSVLKLLYRFTHLDVRLEHAREQSRAWLHLEGAASFLRLPRLAAVLETVPAGVELHVHFEHLRYIDHACLDLLMNWEKQHRTLGGSLVIDWHQLQIRVHQSPFSLRRTVPTQSSPIASETSKQRTSA